MIKATLFTGARMLFVFSACLFSGYIAWALKNSGLGDSASHVAPVFGVAIASVLIGGYRYLPAVFLGALLPSIFTEDEIISIVSVPLAVVFSSVFARRVLSFIEVDLSLARARDGFLILFWATIVGPLLGALVQSALLCAAANGSLWSFFVLTCKQTWFSASIGTIIVAPFILTWAQPVAFRIRPRQILEVALWLPTLISFGHVTFLNWAPTDTLFYPMELAIFPIMAWSAIRFGLRGASAGVIALALLAAWELTTALRGDGQLTITQGPDNIWVFVGIVSLTSVCLASVMTEMVRREARIAENEGRLRAFTDGLPDIAFVLDESGIIRDLFAATPEIRGNHQIIDPEKVRGYHLARLFSDQICRRFLETIEDAVRKKKVCVLEYSIQSLDRRERWFEARVSPMGVRSDEGDRQVVWMAYDITTRKESEEAVRQRDRMLVSTARASGVLLKTSDYDRAINAAISDMGTSLGVDRAYVIALSNENDEDEPNLLVTHEWQKNRGLSLRSILSTDEPELAEMRSNLLRRSTEGDGLVLVSNAQLDPESRTIAHGLQCCSILVAPMLQGGRVSGFFGVDYGAEAHEWNDSETSAIRVLATSISGLLRIRENERELVEAKDRADAASIAKGEFLAVMSHEIRTPMNAIIGYTDLLNQTELDTHQLEYAVIIKRSGQALLELINNILDYSKIESKSLELESSEFDLEQVLCESLEAILPQAREKGLSIDYKIAEELSEQYIGDGHRLRQVLINLSNNAIKFTRSGSILVSVSRERMMAEDEQELLHFEVTDTGCGIPEDKFDLLFEAFSQVDSSTTRRYGGSGLGLAISQRLVAKMRGEIWVESIPNEGSTFHFNVFLKPLVQTQHRDMDHTSRTPVGNDHLELEFAQENPLKILLCEDDYDNQKVIQELLQKLGYEPDIVDEAEQAVEKLKQVNYGAFLLDIRLPKLDGIKLTEEIRGNELGLDTCDQYIIAVTAYAMEEDREKCLRAGMNDYLRKPLKIEDLKAALARACAHARAADRKS